MDGMSRVNPKTDLARMNDVKLWGTPKNKIGFRTLKGSEP